MMQIRVDAQLNATREEQKLCHSITYVAKFLNMSMSREKATSSYRENNNKTDLICQVGPDTATAGPTDICVVILLCSECIYVTLCCCYCLFLLECATNSTERTALKERE